MGASFSLIAVWSYIYMRGLRSRFRRGARLGRLLLWFLRGFGVSVRKGVRGGEKVPAERFGQDPAFPCGYAAIDCSSVSQNDTVYSNS